MILLRILEEDKDEALVFTVDGDKCTRVGEDMHLLRFSISKSMRL